MGELLRTPDLAFLALLEAGARGYCHKVAIFSFINEEDG